MALTTSDELQKQLTVIFGFRGHLNLEVGEIVGIGELTEKNSELLIKDVLNYLNAYNSMLRDYAGCELYAIEFDLENLNEDNQVKLMPKSMLFIPGQFKDCNTLLLLLSPEMSLLNYKKAKKAVENLGKLYFEVEEAVERDELDDYERQLVLSNFANRFALKLQGNVIEGKWNKRLVGLKEETFSEPYLSVNLQNDVRWFNKEITSKNPRFKTLISNLDHDDQFEFLKYGISQSTAYIIAQNTYHLSSDLLQLANTGSTDDTQKLLLNIVLNNFLEYAKKNLSYLTFDEFSYEMGIYLKGIQEYIQEFHLITTRFAKLGLNKNIEELIIEITKSFPSNSFHSEKDHFLFYIQKLLKIHLLSSRYNFSIKKKTRTNELYSPFLYIEKNLEYVISKIEKSLPIFCQQEILDNYSQVLIEMLSSEFDLTGKKPVIALGSKFLEKFAYYLSNEIELAGMKEKTRKEQETLTLFQNIARNSIEIFISEVKIEIEDLLGFCNLILVDIPLINNHIEILMNFRREIEFLWGLVLRSSTLQRFLKEFPEGITFDPKNFSNLFIEFLMKKRLGGLNLSWKHIIYDYIREFEMEYQPLYAKDSELKDYWPKYKTVNLFVEFIGNKVREHTTLEGFMIPLKKYLDQIAMKSIKNRLVLNIYNIYTEGLDVISQFPDYMRQVFYKSIENFSSDRIRLLAENYLGHIQSIDEEISGEIQDKRIYTAQRSFFNFIINHEMRYFSKLIAKPKNILLESLDNESFDKKKLYHTIEFQDLGKNYSKFNISSNYKKIKARFNGR